VTGKVTANPLGGFRKFRDSSGSVEVNDFIGTVLSDVKREFSDGSERSPEADLRTHGKMSSRAVWCACLFWYALGKARFIHKGERETIRDFQPSKVRKLAGMLSEFKKSGLDGPKRWMEAFVQEAARFRDIEPRIRVCHGNRTDLIPQNLFGRYPELFRSPIFEDEDGLPYVNLQRPLGSILKGGETRAFQSSIQPMAPLEGMVLPSFPRRSVAKEFAYAVKRYRNHRFGVQGDQLCEKAANLVSMTGIVPHEHEDDNDMIETHQGSGVA